jgi:hypothetical protein
MVVELENTKKTTSKKWISLDNYANKKWDGDIEWEITGTPELSEFKDRDQTEEVL